MPPVDNLAAALLVAIPALLNIGILLYLMFFLPKGKVVNIFAGFIIGLISWQCFDLITRLDVEVETVQYANKFLNIGWMATGPLLFHFSLLFTKKIYLDNRRIFIFLYLPFFILNSIYVSQFDFNTYVNDDFWGWILIDLDFEELLVRNFVSILVIASMLMLFQHAYVNRNNRAVKFQSLLIATGILIPTLAGVISQIIYPMMTGYEIPITSTFFTFLSISIIISLNDYHLFSISDSVDIESILDNLSGIVLIIDPDEHIIFRNQQAKECFSKGKSDRNFLSIKDYFPDNNYYEDFREEVFTKSMNGATISQYNSKLDPTKDKVIDVSISSELITNNKVKQGILLIATDISQRKRAEKERKDILESITDGFFALDNEWNVTYWNRAAEEILLMPKENIMGENLWEVYEDAVSLKFYEEYHKAVENQEVRTFEEYYPTMNLWFQVSAFPKKDGLTVYFKDITKDKEQEFEILRIKQNREAMINSTDELIWSVNKEFRLITANEQFYQMVEEMTGKRLEEGDHVLIDEFEEELQLKWKEYYSRSFVGEQFTITHKTEFKGKDLYSLVSFNPIFNDQNECIGAACYSKDISERMKYINAIEKQNEKLKSIAWTQSHVVRAPLSRIMGLINIIKLDAINDDELEEYLDHLKKSAKELDNAIRDIVEKAKEVSN